MSNIFILDPIKIYRYSIVQKNIEEILVFIGDVPKVVRKELEKIQRTTDSIRGKNKILEGFYGKKWYYKLGLHNLYHDDRRKIGAQEEPVQNEINGSLYFPPVTPEIIDDIRGEEEMVSANEVPLDSELFDTDDLRVEISDVDFSESDIKQILEPEPEPEPEIKLKEIVELEKERRREELRIKKVEKTKITFIFDKPQVSVYVEDNILELKRKISVITDIPIYRQHLWIRAKNNIIPLVYNILYEGNIVDVNIEFLSTLYDEKGVLKDPIPKSGYYSLENIPISAEFHRIRNMMRIRCYDTFKLMKEYYYKYGITEFYLNDLDEFISPVRDEIESRISEDRNFLEIIYHGFVVVYWPIISLDVFVNYIRNEAQISQSYPDISINKDFLLTQFSVERSILNENIELFTNPERRDDLKNVEKLLYNSITYSLIDITMSEDRNLSVVHIRNLFDNFDLDENINACKCVLIYKNKKITLDKIFKPSYDISLVKDEIPINTVTFRINMNLKEKRYLYLNIARNGNLSIKSRWREEDNYDFDDIFDITKIVIDPIITKINDFGPSVLYGNRKISKLSKKNVRFTDINMNVFFKRGITGRQFELFKSLTEKFSKAGIIYPKEMEDIILKYYFRKGMHQHDFGKIERSIITNNYYEFLTNKTIQNKWISLYQNVRMVKFEHRFSDIKVEIMNIKEDEFVIFYQLITTLFHLFLKYCKINKKECKQLGVTDILAKERKEKEPKRKILSILKEQDPVLYNFDKLDTRSPIIYSKICQKPYQPLLLNERKYEELPKEEKKRAIKYWNFTTNSDAYYICPNKKYPYIKFLVGFHPRGYCIPCCKKTEVAEDPDNPKRIIHEICLKEHKYEKEKKTITIGSKYIMAYGKDIEPGRLSRLPAFSLEPLFYNAHILSTETVESGCDTDGYYLYGMDQNIRTLSNVGYVLSLSNALEMSIEEIVTEIIRRLRIDRTKFDVLLDGGIIRYFANLEELVDALESLFIVKTGEIELYDLKLSNVPWNDLFMDFSLMLLQIHTIKFIQEADEADIYLELPRNMTSYNEFIIEDYMVLFILKKVKKYYPIYLLNIDVFFKTHIINAKLFKSDSDAVNIFFDLVKKYFVEKNIGGNLSNNIDLSIIKKFIDESNLKKKDKYMLSKLYINHSDLCYIVEIEMDKTKLCIPITQSYYYSVVDVELEFGFFQRKYVKYSLKKLLEFVDGYNKWVVEKSKEFGLIPQSTKKVEPGITRPIYPLMYIERWIKLENIFDNTLIKGKESIIGFTCNNLNYYFLPITESTALKLKKVSTLILMYDPDLVNNIIDFRKKPKEDGRTRNINKDLYDYSLYKLLLLGFITEFDKQRNKTLREKIKKLLLKSRISSNFGKIIEELRNILGIETDIEKIRSQLLDYVNIYNNKKTLFDEIDQTTYEFDRIKLEKLKELPKDRIKKELYNISKKFTTITPSSVDKVKNFEMPNIYVSCQNDRKKEMRYCKNKNLIITRDQLLTMIDVITSDVVDPTKNKYIFSEVMIDKVLFPLKFIRRPDEIIYIRYD
jgi:hypothetical protein